MTSEVVHQYVDSGGDVNWTGGGGPDKVTTTTTTTTNCSSSSSSSSTDVVVVVVGNLSSLSWPPPLHPYTTAQISLIALVVAVLSVVTAGGNLMVIISFRMDRQLQTVSNYFLLSLSVADFAIGFVSMPLYTVYLLMNRWPLGPVVCDAWLSVDYTMSNASVANLLVISFDRYFSVTRPLTYRVRRTPRTAAALIAGAWLVSVLLWTPWIVAWPYIEGRREVPDDQCYIQFLETNQYITVVTAVAAFYLPVLAMCVVYYRIYRETEKRQRGLLYLQATSSSLRRLDKAAAAAVDEDPSEYVEMSSRRSSCGRARSATVTTTAFVQSPTPLHYRVRLTESDASERRLAARRRGSGGGLAHCLCCGRPTPTAVHTPPRKSSNSAADDVDSTTPACDRPSRGGGAADAPDRCAESPIPLIRVASLDSRPANVASSAPDSPTGDETVQHPGGLRTAPTESTGASLTSVTDAAATPPSGTTTVGLQRTGRRQVGDAVDEHQATRRDVKELARPAKLSVAVEALLLDGDRARIDAGADGDDSGQVRRASESPCTCDDTPSYRRRQQQQQQSKVSSDALRQALERRINERLTDTARKAQKQRQEKKQDRKAAKTLSAILLAFIVTWTPYNVFTVVRTFVPTLIDPTVYAVGWYLSIGLFA